MLLSISCRTSDKKNISQIKGAEDFEVISQNDGKLKVICKDSTLIEEYESIQALKEAIANDQICYKFEKPSDFVLGRQHGCAIQDDEVVCWHFLESAGEFKTPPSIKEPKKLFARGYHSCVMDSEGYKCWDKTGEISTYYAGVTKLADLLCKDRSGPNNCRDFVNPKQYTFGIRLQHSCVLDDNGVQCRQNPGVADPLIEKIPALNNPTQIASSSEFACALDNDGVKCWGHQRYPIPELSNPKTIAGVYNGPVVCALDNLENDFEMICWGTSWLKDGLHFKPSLTNPTKIGVSTIFCAMGDEGIKCYKDGGNIPERLVKRVTKE